MLVSTIGQELAQRIDLRLMSPAGGWSIFQLMELAGLSVAQAVVQMYPVSTHSRVLVCAGPGNNGGDGLVAARHLFLFGYKPTILYPKRPSKDIFEGLVTQLENLSVPFISDINTALEQTDLVLDAIFGFSFSGEIRPPFDDIIKCLKECKVPICSVDIPSGWDVERGNVSRLGLEPASLISLTAPKTCARLFSGRHFLGGRFVGPGFSQEFGLKLPSFPGADQCVDITTLALL
ncbi:YjeF N-terminal domain-like protein [Zopfochytrium polystomum]|nr:YjeF N-terminal domain-like protein [Zopfochytrium polystomum]